MSGKTSNESKSKYNTKAYDRIELVVKKGLKETIKNHALGQKESTNAFITRAIIEAMERDSAKE